MNIKTFLSIITMTLTVSAVNAQNDNDTFRRCVLLEEFSTENCSICPHITKYVTQLVDDPDYQDKVVAVSHHAGCYEDFLTTQADRDLKWMYNQNPFTPAFMFDRYPYFNTQNTSKLTYTPLGLVNNLASFKDYVDERYKVPSHVTFDITASYDGESSLKVTVSGERDSEFALQQPRITVYLTENNIKAQHQKGVKDEYFHQYAVRSFNESTGAEISWNGDKFTHTCELYVEDSFKPEDLSIVAFVSNYNPEDANDCVVENTRVTTFSQALGINDICAGAELIKTEYFTIDGIKTNLDASGIYLQKKTFSDGRTQVKKIML